MADLAEHERLIATLSARVASLEGMLQASGGGGVAALTARVAALEAVI